MIFSAVAKAVDEKTSATVAEAIAVDEKTFATVAEAIAIDRRFRNKKIEKKKV